MQKAFGLKQISAKHIWKIKIYRYGMILESKGWKMPYGRKKAEVLKNKSKNIWICPQNPFGREKISRALRKK